MLQESVFFLQACLLSLLCSCLLFWATGYFSGLRSSLVEGLGAQESPRFEVRQLIQPNTSERANMADWFGSDQSPRGRQLYLLPVWRADWFYVLVHSYGSLGGENSFHPRVFPLPSPGQALVGCFLRKLKCRKDEQNAKDLEIE